MSTLPWWMYFVIAGILFSGYQFIKANQEDRQADQAFIEEQGQVYMERIEKARKKRSS
ncbi:sporulation YhaL family protein [Pullulanibacillus sp. KACC 23026]|nr:sporulation YhaL family protein [Pullulanibacillus sp. KACC 23026]WEG15034.1 sporulation YhaL family protein [Pullulanibacillus sp. KACC 23026]